ncbi:MAG: right-handed parallel beta-helix repeat-containing protein [Acidobacteria bacterium]|nr:right-handed parallel beta-helix repeat-containing protein [Acidobacteriota bacterium]
MNISGNSLRLVKRRFFFYPLILAALFIGSLVILAWRRDASVVEAKNYNSQPSRSSSVTLSIAGGSSQSGDCQAIQEMIDSLPDTGGEVFIPAGVYTCTKPIVIDRDNVRLYGQGPDTVLRLADGANAPMLVLGQTEPAPTVTRRDIRVSDLVIDGNRANQPDECWGGDCANNPIRNNGITLRRVSDALIARVTVFRARSGGLVSECGCQRLIIRDFTSSDNQFDGLAGYETENSSFSGLRLHDNQAAGLSFDIRFNNNFFSDVIITGSMKVGIFMRDSRDNTFHDLQIRNSKEHGIFLAQVDEDTTTPAAGNTFIRGVISDSRQAGLRVNNESCVNNLVVAFQFSRNGEGCISGAITGLVKAWDIDCPMTSKQEY